MAASSPRILWIYARTTRKDGARSESGGGSAPRDPLGAGCWGMPKGGVEESFLETTDLSRYAKWIKMGGPIFLGIFFLNV